MDLRDLTPSHFILDSLDTLEEEDPNETHHSRKASTVTAVPGSRHPSNAVELDSPVKTHVEQQEIPSPHPEDSMSQFELSPEMQDEIEAQRALHEERSRVNAILKSRPVRMEKGFWRMVWSFIVVEKEANG